MEKKGNRSVQGSSKGLGTDSKKNQDVVGGKQVPRNGRRREPSGGNFPVKSESGHRKPVPQRGKTLDKRPRPRGYGAGPSRPSDGGNENARLGDRDEPELGSVFVQGSKKQSLNHLVGFYFNTRESSQRGSNGGYSRTGNNRFLNFKHKYNKEHYIQANCQFLVNSTGDYKQYMNNPDALVDWSLIEQVNVQVHELPSCPICLYQPVAAKMTRCGHIYCWSCVLHYLALSDNAWRKCPICFESVHKHDLKSVVPVPHASFNTNETITFKLMKRARGSLIAYPIEEPVHKPCDQPFNLLDEQASKIYCKLLLADKNDIKRIINREKQELTSQLREDNNPESCFIEQAIGFLKERENFIVSTMEESKTCDLKQLNVNAAPFVSSGIETKIENLNVKRVESVNEEDAGESRTSETKYFYFYQANDGQHIYLHAVNVKMLEHTYGSLEYCPKILTGRIIEKVEHSMTEEIRNRYRYLQHLPVTCQFDFAEIQLKTPTVSRETLDFFSAQIESRKKQRKNRAREERQREKRIAEEENRKMGKFPAANIELESHHQFPEFGSENVRERTISGSSPRSASPISTISEQTIDSNSGWPIETSYSAPSFAKMLSTSSKNVTSPSSKNQTASSSTPRLINVTGAKFQTTQAKVDDDEPESEDYVPAPEYNRSFSDAIAMALEKASRANENSNGQSKSGKKKKKNKPTFLFANSMNYNGN